MHNLDKGIFLEDKNINLEWGRFIKNLALENNAEINKYSDRTIINWGTHTIFDGLSISLSNTFFGLSKYLLFKKFTLIEHNTIGDKESFRNFELISTHLTSKIGKPTEITSKVDVEGERFLVWTLKNCKINLLLFEQHVFRLNLKIERI